MSKVKEAYVKQLESEFELELSYNEWLRDNYSEPSGDELDEMEEDFKKSSTEENRIIAHKPLNNLDYYPKYGA